MELAGLSQELLRLTVYRVRLQRFNHVVKNIARCIDVCIDNSLNISAQPKMIKSDIMETNTKACLQKNSKAKTQGNINYSN